MRRIFIVSSIILGAIGVFGIMILVFPFPPRTPAKINFFANSDCMSACWQGLRPGYSTLNDVEAFYAQNLARINTYINDDIKLTTIGASHYDEYGNRDYQVIASFRENDLVDIFLVADRPPTFDLQINTILAILGDPEYTLVSYIPVAYEMGEPRTIIPYMELYYPDTGYIFYAELNIQSQVDKKYEVCVQPEDYVSKIHIVAPNSIREIIKASYTSLTPPSSTFLDMFVGNLKNWEGYRCYTFELEPLTRVE